MSKAIAEVEHEHPGASQSKVVALARKKVEEIVERSKPLDKDCSVSLPWQVVLARPEIDFRRRKAKEKVEFSFILILI